MACDLTDEGGESMEPQTPISGVQGEFAPQSTVIYALHGKCLITGIESRTIGAETLRFYKLEVQKSALSRSQRQEPAIWVPVNSAKDQGLRAPMTAEEAETVLRTLSSREYFFQINESWSAILPKLETSIRIEGGIGMAKVLSYLFVLKRKQVVPTPEVSRFYESVSRLLLRELSEILGKPIRTLEDQIARGFRQKLLPDS
jgi:RNA polymerase-interacting CarD/CdnL/TRCF family regulator